MSVKTELYLELYTEEHGFTYRFCNSFFCHATCIGNLYINNVASHTEYVYQFTQTNFQLQLI